MKRINFVAALTLLSLVAWGGTIKVPSEQPTIAAAVAAATAGDTILLAVGTHSVEAKLEIDKPLTIASHYLENNREESIKETIVQGLDEAGKQWFTLTKAATGSRVVGLTFQGNNSHTLAIENSDSEVSHCRFIGGVDQLSFEGGGGRVAYCHFEGARDDAIDADESVSWVVEHCSITKCRDDGIEIRLHKKGPPLTTHIVRHNDFSECGRTGVQLIDYDGDSHREFKIYDNTFRNTGSTAVDCTLDTANRNTNGSPMVESACIFNNTFIECRNGVTLAPRVAIFNNIFYHIREFGIVKGEFLLDKTTLIEHNLFFGNANDWSEGLVVGESVLKVDPKFKDVKRARLAVDSPALKAGIATPQLGAGHAFTLPDNFAAAPQPLIGAYRTKKR